MSIAISFRFSGRDVVAHRRRRHQDTSSMQSPPTRPPAATMVWLLKD